jgi:chromosome segregation ATPase
MSSPAKTSKQLTAAKRKRSTTLKKLDKNYKEIRELSDKLESLRINWVNCMDKNVNPFELKVSKKELNKLETPCKKIRNEMNKITKKQKKLNVKSEELETIAGNIEIEFNIPANASY